MTTSPNLGLSYLVASQAQKEVTHNEALNVLDALVQAVALDRDLSAPPSEPTDGDCYIVGESATDDWEGQDGNLAFYYAGWSFLSPQKGWQIYLQDEEATVLYNGSSWEVFLKGKGYASLSWTPGTIADGASALSDEISISDVSFGDYAQCAAPYDLQGVQATSYVSSAGNVRICINNNTGASITLSSGEWGVHVQKA